MADEAKDDIEQIRADLAAITERLDPGDPTHLPVLAGLRAAMLLDKRLEHNFKELDHRLEQIFNKIGTLDVRLR